jgi:hypothetical protein
MSAVASVLGCKDGIGSAKDTFPLEAKTLQVNAPNETFEQPSA